jgi:serine/threonine protein kinase
MLRVGAYILAGSLTTCEPVGTVIGGQRTYNRSVVMSLPKVSERYQVTAVLARGGMGVVYEAYDKTLGRKVALKTILRVEDETAVQLFQKEWKVLASLTHPNIIDIIDIGQFKEDGGLKPYFVMPLLSGATLERNRTVIAGKR